jgi:hypothetical protein
VTLKPGQMVWVKEPMGDLKGLHICGVAVKWCGTLLSSFTILNMQQKEGELWQNHTLKKYNLLMQIKIMK